MSLTIRVADSRDGARIVEALLLAGDVVRTQKPLLARRYESIANAFGDALDQSDAPFWRPGPAELSYDEPPMGDRDEVARRRAIVEARRAS